jgi:serine/threonine protein kinase
VAAGRLKGLEGTVAVKVVNSMKFRDLRDLDAIRNEIAVMASMRHPHIIECLDSEYRGDKIFIVLEFARGGDLKEYIHREVCLSGHWTPLGNQELRIAGSTRCSHSLDLLCARSTYCTLAGSQDATHTWCSTPCGLTPDIFSAARRVVSHTLRSLSCISCM